MADSAWPDQLLRLIFFAHRSLRASLVCPQDRDEYGESSSVAMGPMDAQPATFPQFTQSPHLPPLVAGGGCPFRQGELADVNVPDAAAHVQAPSPVVPKQGKLPLQAPAQLLSMPPVQQQQQQQMAPQQPPQLQQMQQQMPPAQMNPAQMPPKQTQQQMQGASAAPPPPLQGAVAAPPALSPAQMAAFQAAYAKALAEQKSLYQAPLAKQAAAAPQRAPAARQPAGQMVGQAAGQQAAGQLAGQPGPHAPHVPLQGRVSPAQPSAARGGAGRGRGDGTPQPNAPRNGGKARVGVGELSGGPTEGVVARPSSSVTSTANAHAEMEAGQADGADEDEDSLYGKVLATSCAHGPLVTHPATSMTSGMLASVFPSSNESWLYVTVAGEFGSQWAMGIAATGVACGRLHFKPRMQQWVLVEVEPDA